MGIEDLQNAINSAQQLKEQGKNLIETAKSTAGGLKGMARKMAREAIKKAKIELEMKIEYTKQLIPLLGQEQALQAQIQMANAALGVAQSGLNAAQQTLDNAKAEYDAAAKLIAQKQRKAQYGGQGPSDDQKKAMENAKNIFTKAQDGLNSAKQSYKTAAEEVNKLIDNLTEIQKSIEVIKIGMGTSDGSTPAPQIQLPSLSSSNNQQTQKPDPQPSSPLLSPEEVQQAKAQADKAKQTKEEEAANMDTSLERIDAEWMVIENGITILNNFATPVPQVATLPAAVGTAAPNPAFNMAVAGSIGLCMVFILCEIKAAIIRWSALCEENNVTPTPDQMAKIAMVSAFSGTIPTTCATGAVYVTPALPGLM